jgi:glucosamine-6-phosphate deaminase
MADIYSAPIVPGDSNLPIPVTIVENDTELYWRMALDMFREVSVGSPEDSPTVFIVPVGPVWQYRRFILLVKELGLDLSQLHLFFMDEYLADGDSLIDAAHPLSFRGFVENELDDLLTAPTSLFTREQIHFPDPADPGDYDEAIADMGGADVCYAGVGINGHLAFNEAPCGPDEPSRVLELTPETITTNSHTALGGAYERIPRKAVTVGMKSILSSRRLSLWMNRPWQQTAARKLLFGPVGRDFPASFAREHENASLTMTSYVAEVPKFGLR